MGLYYERVDALASQEPSDVDLRLEAAPEARGLLDFYASTAGIPSVNGRRSRQRITYPRAFSLIENPEQTLQTIAELVSACVSRKTEIIELNQSRCQLLDHGAESVMHSLAREAQERCKIKFAGRVPAAKDQACIVRATGLAKQLGLDGWNTPEPGFLALPLERGQKEPARPRQSTRKEIMTWRLAQYFDECLGRFGYQMRQEARNYLCELTGEVIANAEEHSNLGVWYIAAYLRHTRDTANADCHITIFNYGQTLSESLNSLPLDSRLGRDIQARLARAKRHRKSLPAECLLTLLALQQGVSRHNTDPSRLGDRGQGTVRMIEFFQQVGCTKDAQLGQRMCIVSGRAHILFDGSHRMSRVRGPSGEDRMIIAFNEANDLNAPPDPRYVRRLKRPFPGTIISMRFHLEGRHLASLGGEE